MVNLMIQKYIICLIQQLNLKISYTTYNKYINNLLEKEIIKKREITNSNQKNTINFYFSNHERKEGL